MILAKIEQHSWDSPDRTLSSAIRKNRLIIFTGDEKQNGPVKTRVTCQFMVKRPFSLDEMQPDRYMPMPSVHYGQNSIVGPKIMRHFCDNLIQILELFIQVSIVFVANSGSFRKDADLDDSLWCSSICFPKKVLRWFSFWI